MATHPRRSLTPWWVAIALAALVPLWFVVGALGTRFGLWSYGFGLGTMYIGWGRYVILAGLVVVAIALIAALLKPPRFRPVLLSLVAFMLVAIAGMRLLGLGLQAQSVPPIHDVQTDWSDPVDFSPALLAARGDGANPVQENPVIPEAAEAQFPGYGGVAVSKAQEDAEPRPGPDGDLMAAPYPSLDTVILTGFTKTQVFDAALRVAERNEWEIVTSDPAAGILEATETSLWFGFKDDIAVRIRETEAGTEVDIRSVSRVGLSDLGANAKRIGNVIRDLRGSLTPEN